MENLNIFVPIQKVDAAKRLVYGCLAAEVPDHSGEILDYEGSVPYFKAWSSEFEKVTDGKSKGNVRVMHGSHACGKLTDISFDDANKAIMGCAKIVDDAEWAKVEEGVYTGFSIGGKYVKRWIDPKNASLKRYIPEMIEISLVDKPCIPVATFDYIKADGSHELREFQVAKEAEEVGVAIKQVWEAKDGSTFSKKADAVNHNVELAVKDALAPLTKALQAAEEKLAAREQPEKADKPTEVAKSDEDEQQEVKTGADDGQEADESTDAQKRAPDEDKAAALTKAIATVKESMTKGIYDVARLACIIDDLSWLQESIQWDAMYEDDGSPLPADLKTILATLCDFLKRLVEEETSELTADKADGLTQAHVDALRKVTGKEDLLKDFALPEADLEKLQSEHTETLAKLEEANAEKAAMAKAISTVTETVEALNKRIEHLEAQPAPAKGVKTVTKGHEGDSGQSPVEDFLKGRGRMSPEGMTKAVKDWAAKSTQ
ncbi:MAG: hypothetical protein AB7U64_23410 [Blastocatellales bacterium]